MGAASPEGHSEEPVIERHLPPKPAHWVVANLNIYWRIITSFSSFALDLVKDVVERGFKDKRRWPQLLLAEVCNLHIPYKIWYAYYIWYMIVYVGLGYCKLLVCSLHIINFHYWQDQRIGFCWSTIIIGKGSQPLHPNQKKCVWV